MGKNYKAIDTTKGFTDGYIKQVCFRNEHLKKQVGPFKWFILTLVEFIVGAELIESIIFTGSVPPHKNLNKNDSEQYGNELHLTLHIPAGLITNLLRNQIIELLYYKFYSQYLILEQVGNVHIDDNKKTINCTRTRFRARKNLFSQFIAVRRVYDLFWLIVNLMVDLIVFIATTDIQLVLLSALIVEAFRRVLRV